MQGLLDSLRPGDEEEPLARAIDPGRLPAHIAIIMDGNGRWAKRRGQLRMAGHKAGMRPVRTVIEACSQMNLKALTLYAFSIENWKRPRREVEMLWRLLRTYLKLELPEMMRQNIRLNAIGRLDALPPLVSEELKEVLAQTSGNPGLQVNLAINYGGRAELVDAVKALVEQARQRETVIDEAAIEAHLYTAGIPDPDLLIRTSGEMRVSNFLLWQIAYAELYVSDTLWPDFTRADLLRAILDYQKRDRRFGGLGAEHGPRGEDRFAEALGHNGQMKRVITALILIPFIAWVTLAAPLWVFLTVLAITGLLAFYEFDQIVATNGIARAGWPGMAAGLVLMLSPAPLVAIVLIAMLGMVLALRVKQINAALPAAGAFALGIVYVFGSWRCAADLRAINPHWLLFAMVLSWAGDTAALYVGRPFGKHKMAPRVSPAKSWEGAAGSVAGGVLVGGIYAHYLIPQAPLGEALILAAVGNIAGQVGDLCESALKRGAGMKDSGTLLPGHGGWLDRLDSSLFSVPAVYALLLLFMRLGGSV